MATNIPRGADKCVCQPLWLGDDMAGGKKDKTYPRLSENKVFRSKAQLKLREWLKGNSENERTPCHSHSISHLVEKIPTEMNILVRGERGMIIFFPFPFPNCGHGFFHSLPVLELWELIFQIPSRS